MRKALGSPSLENLRHRFRSSRPLRQLMATSTALLGESDSTGISGGPRWKFLTRTLQQNHEGLGGPGEQQLHVRHAKQDHQPKVMTLRSLPHNDHKLLASGRVALEVGIGTIALLGKIQAALVTRQGGLAATEEAVRLQPRLAEETGNHEEDPEIARLLHKRISRCHNLLQSQLNLTVFAIVGLASCLRAHHRLRWLVDAWNVNLLEVELHRAAAEAILVAQRILAPLGRHLPAGLILQGVFCELKPFLNMARVHQDTSPPV